MVSLFLFIIILLFISSSSIIWHFISINKQKIVTGVAAIVREQLNKVDGYLFLCSLVKTTAEVKQKAEITLLHVKTR